MLKKSLVWLTVVVSVFVIGIKLFDIYIYESTDECIMNKYVQDCYGDNCYGELIGKDDDERIEFIVYEEGGVRELRSIDREYYAHKYD